MSHSHSRKRRRSRSPSRERHRSDYSRRSSSDKHSSRSSRRHRSRERERRPSRERHERRSSEREKKRRRTDEYKKKAPRVIYKSEMEITYGNIYEYKHLGMLSEGTFGHVFLGEYLGPADKKEILPSIQNNSQTGNGNNGKGSEVNGNSVKSLNESSVKVLPKNNSVVPGTKVAIKKLKLPEEDDGFYMREIENLVVLSNHEHIVKLLGVATNKNLDKFLVFEYCEYVLKHFLQEQPKPHLSIVKNLMLQLFKGLDFVHRQGVMHRDIKPENLLITKRGILKIADFGSSRKISKKENYTPGLVTLRYRAPEIFLGDVNYTTSLDMWSAGCIFCEMLLGKPLLDGTSELEQIDKMVCILGSPTTENWPGLPKLPNSKTLKFPNQPNNQIIKHIPNQTKAAYDLINKLLCYDPGVRLSAEEASKQEVFFEDPLPLPEGELKDLEILDIAGGLAVV